MSKPFPLFDDLVELCDAVIAMGVGEFRGTGDSFNEEDGEGSVEEEGYEEPAVSEDWDINDPVVHLISFTLFWLMKYVQRSVGMTPTFEKLAPKKCRAPDTPRSSGHLPDKHQC